MARRVTDTFDFARNAAASFSGPSDIDILPAGNLYVTDQGDEASNRALNRPGIS